jgi:hypothetical protein
MIVGEYQFRSYITNFYKLLLGAPETNSLSVQEEFTNDIT